MTSEEKGPVWFEHIIPSSLHWIPHVHSWINCISVSELFYTHCKISLEGWTILYNNILFQIFFFPRNMYNQENIMATKDISLLTRSTYHTVQGDEIIWDIYSL